MSSRISDVCNETPWCDLADRVLVVDLGPRQASCMVAKTRQAGFPGYSAVVMCPRKPVVAMLQDGPSRSLKLGTRKARVHAPETQFSLAPVGRP